MSSARAPRSGYLARVRPRIQYPRSTDAAVARGYARPFGRVADAGSLPQVDLAAARQPARPAPGIEARRERRRHDDLRGGLAAQLFELAASALDGGGGAGGELLDGVAQRGGVLDLEDQR